MPQPLHVSVNKSLKFHLRDQYEKLKGLGNKKLDLSRAGKKPTPLQVAELVKSKEHLLCYRCLLKSEKWTK